MSQLLIFVCLFRGSQTETNESRRRFSDDLKDTHLHFQWRNVSIREYDAKKQLWHVSTDDQEHDVFDMYRPAKRSRKQKEAIEGKEQVNGHSATNGQSSRDEKRLHRNHLFLGNSHHHHHQAHGAHGLYWVPRIQLHFLAEDPRIFADRVAKAYHDRKRTESELRSSLFIDCMPTDGIGKLDDERIKRMIELTKTSAISKTMYVTKVTMASIVSLRCSKDEYVTPIVEEVNLDYARTMNSMIFEEVTQSDPISFAFITLPKRTRRAVPATGCVDIPEYSFNEVFDQFKVSLIDRDLLL